MSARSSVICTFCPVADAFWAIASADWIAEPPTNITAESRTYGRQCLIPVCLRPHQSEDDEFLEQLGGCFARFVLRVGSGAVSHQEVVDGPELFRCGAVQSGLPRSICLVHVATQFEGELQEFERAALLLLLGLDGFRPHISSAP